MKVTYYVLNPRGIQVGDEWREVGDLVPEARDWPFLHAYVRDGDLGVVLVATLPSSTRKALEEWDAEMSAVPEDDDVPTTGAPNPDDLPEVVPPSEEDPEVPESEPATEEATA